MAISNWIFNLAINNISDQNGIIKFLSDFYQLKKIMWNWYENINNWIFVQINHEMNNYLL